MLIFVSTLLFFFFVKKNYQQPEITLTANYLNKPSVCKSLTSMTEGVGM